MKKIQHSKLVYNILLINGILWVWVCFILAYLDKTQIAERLAVASVTTILGSFVALCTKSYKETKQEKIQELEEAKFLNNLDYSFDEETDAEIIDNLDDFDEV